MQKIKKRWRLLLALLIVLWSGFAGISIASNKADVKTQKKEYKVGDRLPNKSISTVNSAGYYRKLNWDELMPADWDPMKALKGLDLSKLKDSDPRAMEAMERVREAWKDSPIVFSLNGARIEIPGFVVPLDVNYDNVKEFLLVPFFGACIHVPPPPGNQTLHILVPKSLTKKQQKLLKRAMSTYGTISISGTLKTVSSNTSMGFASYQIKADLIEPYKPPNDLNDPR
ncbi:conserved hypothetical protein [Candidatus Nitrotoga sp. BS]|uniref:DUF3299 domain-containing protein n=1 Tax=Candidatus Nitrotoga sp. BS TaxID=2890408 RepID=UPI001EF1DFD5|nr:DUF3299 domain-containing protein [Candidatus Nitrotoga sp. BS]CAH1202524.1 conserved hypothetical protein [Candidatus Nitrotoga sp. BS]